MKASCVILFLCSPEFFFFFLTRDSGLGSCLRTAHRPLGYRGHQEQRAPSLYYKQSVTHRGRYLMSLCDFFRSRLAAGHSQAVRARPDLATLSFSLLVPLAFSPCPDVNGGIGLLAIGSSECSSLHLP